MGHELGGCGGQRSRTAQGLILWEGLQSGEDHGMRGGAPNRVEIAANRQFTSRYGLNPWMAFWLRV